MAVTVGYSAFQNNLIVSDIDAVVRLQVDVRVTGVSIVNSSGDAFSNYEDYNVNSFNSGLVLPNSDSKVTYKVDVTNFGNVYMAISDIVGLPNNLKYSIQEGNYSLGEKICDNNNSSSCKLGAVKSLYITVEYGDNGYDSNNINYNIGLNFDFKRVFSITYKNITVNNYPVEVLEGSTLNITFTGDDIPD